MARFSGEIDEQAIEDADLYVLPKLFIRAEQNSEALLAYHYRLATLRCLMDASPRGKFMAPIFAQLAVSASTDWLPETVRNVDRVG